MFTIKLQRRKFFALCALVALILAPAPRPGLALQLAFCASPSAPGSAYITVNADQDPFNGINVRSGPNSYLYDVIGKLYPAESAPAVGVSPGGDWFQISCPGLPGGVGWVYAANVTLTASSPLPIATAPVTVTPLVTSTFDPTLVAAFPTHATATRPPTFTPAPPQPPPVFTDAPVSTGRGIPAPLIVGLAGLGIALMAVSLFVRR